MRPAFGVHLKVGNLVEVEIAEKGNFPARVTSIEGRIITAQTICSCLEEPTTVQIAPMGLVTIITWEDAHRFHSSKTQCRLQGDPGETLTAEQLLLDLSGNSDIPGAVFAQEVLKRYLASNPNIKPDAQMDAWHTEQLYWIFTGQLDPVQQHAAYYLRLSNAIHDAFVRQYQKEPH